MFSHLAVVMILAGANPAENAPEPYRELGERLVESLRSGDIVGYAHCWLPVCRISDIALASKRPIPKDKLKAMEAYFRKRNQQVAHSFNVLSDLLKKQGKLKNLKLVDVTIQGKVGERDGLRQVTMFYVKVAMGEAKYKITVDDGFEDRGKWFFSDTPLYVEGGPEKELVSLQIKDDE